MSNNLYILLFQILLKDTIKFNNSPNYLLNLLEKEDKSIEDYCLNYQVKQDSTIIG